MAIVLLASVLNVQSKDDDEKAKKDNVGTVIGIDLGTTYSWSVAVKRKRKYECRRGASLDTSSVLNNCNKLTLKQLLVIS